MFSTASKYIHSHIMTADLVQGHDTNHSFVFVLFEFSSYVEMTKVTAA